jgi:hypothetical protein
MILLGGIINISITLGVYSSQKGNQKDLNMTQTGNKTSSLLISTPPDITILPNDTITRIRWDFVYFNAFGEFWQLFLNGNPIDNGTLTNNSAEFITPGLYSLESGSHNFTIFASVFGFDNITITKEDTVLVHVIATQFLATGTTPIHLDGIPQTDVIPTVNQSVVFTITPSSSPPLGSEQALKDFQTENPTIILTNHYLEIDYSQNVVTDLWLNISYSDWPLIDALEIDPSTLRIFAFDTESTIWKPAGVTGVDLENKVLYSHINPPNTSYTVGGSSPTLTGGTGPPPTTTITTTNATTPGFSDMIVLVVIALGLGITKKFRKTDVN